MSDWRITNQHKYLDDVTLIWDKYPDHISSDHAHCEFCFLKFPYEAKMGYRTKDFKHWICKECFEDFKNEFHWKIVNVNILSLAPAKEECDEEIVRETD